jgi:hypothetical protein
MLLEVVKSRNLCWGRNETMMAGQWMQDFDGETYWNIVVMI